MTVAVLFPGQGSQHVGMGADLFAARPDLLGDSANEIVGFDLEHLCLSGPEEALTRTEHAQPALFAVAYALWAEVSAALGLVPDAAAGHSLGEYTALAASGMITYEDALRLVTARGRAMAAAAESEPSGMAALIGADRVDAERVCAARAALGGRLQTANINAPGQVVVAGSREDIYWLAENARDLGVRRAVPLKVAGAFHSSFMASAAETLRETLDGVPVTAGDFPVYANVTAKPHDPSTLRETLARQVVEPVRFSESLVEMSAAGVDTFVHIGPGDVTAGLARRTVPGATVLTISSLEDVRSAGNEIVTIDGR